MISYYFYTFSTVGIDNNIQVVAMYGANDIKRIYKKSIKTGNNKNDSSLMLKSERFLV